jgi:hypothetical protein
LQGGQVLTLIDKSLHALVGSYIRLSVMRGNALGDEALPKFRPAP